MIRSKNYKEADKYLIVLLVCVIALLFGIIFGILNGDDKSSQKDIVDKNPVTTLTDVAALTPFSSEETDAKIVFPGFSKSIIKYDVNKKLYLINPKQNRVDFVYTIKYKDEIIYQTSKISPNNIQEFDLHKYFKESGVYKIEIIINTFSEDDKPRNGLSQDYVFELE